MVTHVPARASHALISAFLSLTYRTEEERSKEISDWLDEATDLIGRGVAHRAEDDAR